LTGQPEDIYEKPIELGGLQAENPNTGLHEYERLLTTTPRRSVVSRDVENVMQIGTEDLA